MESKSEQSDVKIDPVGRKMYEEVLQKDLFEDSPPPLVGLRLFTVNHLFANVWSRSQESSEESPPLSLRERRLITIALLATQGHKDQLEDHVTGAYRAGIEKESLIDLMIHVAHYAGWAAGTSGQKIVQCVYKGENVSNRQTPPNKSLEPTAD